MALSRKHYEAIAGILASNTQPKTGYSAGFDEGWATGMEEMRQYVVDDLADYFATENPNFDRERFLKAAGVN